MKKLTIMMATAALCCCLGSCNSGTKQELANTVHLKGQLLDMGSQNVRMRFDGAASMLGDSRDILLKRMLPVILILLLYLKSRHIILSAATHCILLQEMT